MVLVVLRYGSGGPEGGSGGGEILCEGTPEDICENERSHTARFLKPMLKLS